jgi:hypothetical protein
MQYNSWTKEYGMDSAPFGNGTLLYHNGNKYWEHGGMWVRTHMGIKHFQFSCIYKLNLLLRGFFFSKWIIMNNGC